MTAPFPRDESLKNALAKRVVPHMSRLFLGRAGQAIEPFQRGLRLSPHDPLAFLWLHFLAFAHFLTGEYEESLQPALNAAAKRPDLPSTHCALVCCLVELGRQREAEQAAAEMQRNSSEGQEELGEFVSRFVNPEQREQIRTSLRKAGWQGNW
ncbi:hypothetical protein [Sinorhizobium sp. CCBAU 05631]|uniref:tetratricopeptide repeat protein n=1 Tax=Sinorhizobium sp. CCBAU 05631 TaxID=794846 RepID=UPI000BACA998|nr:hypothetical protein [Sinorhizobium sp. CCBAU 05631]ASY56891.1 Adenylate cyclase [Sinorhizobium sp. CCBAU 05631]